MPYGGASCFSSGNKQVEGAGYQVLHVETGTGMLFLLGKTLGCFSG